MLGKLFLLFTVVPAVELYLLVTIGTWLGAAPTIGLVLATGFVGAFLAKREGLRVLRNWQQSMARGQLPADGVISGLLVLVGGVLLVTPGVLTDVLGLSLLVPPVRRTIAAIVARRAQAAIADGSFSVHRMVHVSTVGEASASTVVDVDARPVDPTPTKLE